MLRSSMLQARVLGLFAQSLASSQTLVQRGLSTGAKSTYNVPEGHHNSDLSSSACHIGLGRRRDLNMRQDLALWKNDTKLSLADVFKGVKALLVGFPGGKVCTEQHIPGYCTAAPELKQLGVDKVVCVTVSDPEPLQRWAAERQFDQAPLLEVLADRNGGVMRLLGMDTVGESGLPDSVKCQRFAAVIDNGILLRLRVEQHPAELKVSDVKSMMQTWSEAYA